MPTPISTPMSMPTPMSAPMSMPTPTPMPAAAAVLQRAPADAAPMASPAMSPAAPPREMPSADLPSPPVVGEAVGAEAVVGEAVVAPLLGTAAPTVLTGPEPPAASPSQAGSARSPIETIQRSMPLVVPDLPHEGTPVGPIGSRPLQRIAGPAGLGGADRSASPSGPVHVPAIGSAIPGAAPGRPPDLLAVSGPPRGLQRTTPGQARGSTPARGASPAVQALFSMPSLPLPRPPAIPAPDLTPALGEALPDAMPAPSLVPTVADQVPTVGELPDAVAALAAGAPAAAAPGRPAPSGGASPAGGAAPGGAAADVDALVRRLYDPLARRLKAELRLDRERVGRALDLRH
jgi:hypothetical protein